MTDAGGEGHRGRDHGRRQEGGGQAGGMLSPRGALTIDQRTNSLVVRDIPDNVVKIREFIDRRRSAGPSVLIEARLVEMTRQDARSLGVIWGGLWTPRATNGPILDVRGAPPGGPVSGETAGAATPTTAANFPASLGSLLAGATPFGLGIGWLASNFALDLQLQALEGQRRARILSSPSLMTVDNQPATVASGRKFPIISLTGVQGAQQASITFQDVTTRLQVTPRVVGDGRILLTIAREGRGGDRANQHAVPDRSDRRHPADGHPGRRHRRRDRRDRRPSPGSVPERRARGAVAVQDARARVALQERPDRDGPAGVGRVPHGEGGDQPRPGRRAC